MLRPSRFKAQSCYSVGSSPWTRSLRNPPTTPAALASLLKRLEARCISLPSPTRFRRPHLNLLQPDFPFDPQPLCCLDLYRLFLHSIFLPQSHSLLFVRNDCSRIDLRYCIPPVCVHSFSPWHSVRLHSLQPFSIFTNADRLALSLELNNSCISRSRTLFLYSLFVALRRSPLFVVEPNLYQVLGPTGYSPSTTCLHPPRIGLSKKSNSSSIAGCAIHFPSIRLFSSAALDTASSVPRSSMDHSSSQKPRTRTDDDRGTHTSQFSQIPQPHNKFSSRNLIQLAAPPRAHQYQRPGPPNPYNGQPRTQHHDRSVNTSEHSSKHPPPQAPLPRPNRTYSNRNAPGRQPSLRSYQDSGRHISHISALSVSQPDIDSRPVSEFTVVSPALPSKAVSEIGEEEEYNARTVPHSRATSQGRKTKTTTPVKSKKNNTPIRDSETLPSGDQPATMDALTAAIRQGLGPSGANSRSVTPKPFSEVTGMRMPFQGEPSSPSSVYTDFTATNQRLSAPLSSFQGYDRHDTPTIVEQEMDEYDQLHYGRDLPTPMSTHPMIGTGSPGMSSKVPPGKRPLRLDIGAVREAEARGSMTSLSDLIKRATQLASNLDRGRTASRLGHLAMFGSTDRLGNARNSTYSDVLDAFPPPAHGTSLSSARPTTLWPNGDKQFMASKSSLGRFVNTNEKSEAEQPRRRCCGMSPVVFVLVLITVILLVAAAVLVPVFLLVLPKQHQSVNLTTCHSSHSCQNGGYSVSANDMCSCVCVDGFTGADCSTQRDPECITAAVADGRSTYDNATLGSSILPLLQNAQTSFNILLNTTKLLSRFAYNNLSCASENSLVDFGDTRSARVKRFVVVPGMMSTEPHVPALNLPPSESKQQHPRFIIVDDLEDAAEGLALLPPTRTLHPRQDATQSANGIVFATSSDAASSPTATVGASTATATPSTVPSTTKINATDNQLDFAATVVLYVLQTSSQVNDAVTANQLILAHFQETDSTNSTVVVKNGKDGIQADFDKFQITLSNGTTLGGSGKVKSGS